VLADKCAVVPRAPVVIGARDDAHFRCITCEAVGRDAAEGDHVEAGAAVVNGDLDRDHFAHAGQLSNLVRIELRESAGLRAEPVLAIDDQGRVRGTQARRAIERILHRLHGREQEHSRRDAEQRQQRPHAVAQQLLGGQHRQSESFSQHDRSVPP
jgi:hypothetical protein